MVIPIPADSSIGDSQFLPSAPPYENLLPNTPSVGFIIVQNNVNVCLIYADKLKLIDSNTEFSKILTGGTKTKQIDGNYVVSDVDSGDFELVIR